MQGWIKLHRKLLENPIFNDPHLLKLWIYCLLKATHKERKQIVGKQIVELKPGQFVTGRFALAEEYNRGVKPKDIVSDRTLWRWIKFLEECEFLSIKSTTKYSVITITNWDRYQENDQQMTNKRPSNDQQMTTNKNDKNEKNDKKEDYTSKIKDLLAAFNQKIPGFIDLNKRYWDVIRETRKTGKISKSVIYNNMKKWEKYSPVVIEYALTTHIHNHAGKREEYTLGIMRRTNEHEARRGLIKLKNKGGAMIENHQRDNPEGPQYDYGF